MLRRFVPGGAFAEKKEPEEEESFREYATRGPVLALFMSKIRSTKQIRGRPAFGGTLLA